MTELWAHKNPETEARQLLSDHLVQVAEHMLKNLTPVQFPKLLSEKTDLQYYLRRTGKQHDIGKATIWFQRHLEDEKFQNAKSRHAMLSAVLTLENESISLPDFLMFMAVKCHHTGLSTEVPHELNEAWSNIEEQFSNCKKQLHGHQLETCLPEFCDFEKVPKALRRTKRKNLKKNDSAEPFFLLQFLFSKLIAADKLDSAELLNYTNARMQGDIERVLRQKRLGSSVALNNDREEIRLSVLEQIEHLTEEQIQSQRLFTITAPTGTGKTLTGLSAALALADRIEENEGFRPHLISAVPFINILEQSQQDYKAVFDGLSDVFVHYGISDPLKVKSEGAELPLRDQMLLLSSWQAPVIMTTFVQLFESILTGKNSRLLKLNQLAGAIVILDEVQALNAEYYPLFAVVMDCAAKYYGTRFILMTATQPRIFACASYLGYQVPQYKELLPEHSKYFSKLCRTKLIPRWDEINTLEKLSESVLEASEEYDSVLCVVNKIQDSLDLYQSLIDTGKNVLYLSTNIISKDRKRVIAQAKQMLGSQPFIMVSTQAIEAGVDLDFDAGFRDLAPMESIIQVAGRINRSGSKQSHAPVFLCDTGSGKSIYGSLSCRLVRNTITEDIQEADYGKMLNTYFEKMLSDNISFDARIYREGILPLDYSILEEFHMISEQDRKTVLIVKDDEIEQEIFTLCELLKENDHTYEQRAKVHRQIGILGAYTVDIYINKLYTNRPPSMKDCYGIDLDYFVANRDDWERYYSEQTGFIAQQPEVYLY